MALRLLHFELPWLRGAFNFGGPGWLHPVCEISVHLDSNDLGNGVYSSDSVVSGHVAVEGPPQEVPVKHDGVVLSVEEVVVLRDSEEEGILQSIELELASPGTLRGRLELPFGVGLGGCERAWQAGVSGVLFSVRHQLTVRLRRPRYTLDVVERIPLRIVAVGPAPHEDFGTLSPDAPSAARHHLLLIDADAEELSMDFGKNCYNVGDAVKGVVVVRTPRQQIHRLEVMLLRSEAVGQDVSEIVVACFDCFSGVFRYRPDGQTAPFGKRSSLRRRRPRRERKEDEMSSTPLRKGSSRWCSFATRWI